MTLPYLLPHSLLSPAQSTSTHQRKRSRNLDESPRYLPGYEGYNPGKPYGNSYQYTSTDESIENTATSMTFSTPVTPASVRNSKYTSTYQITPSSFSSSLKSVRYEVLSNDDFIFDCPMVVDFSNGQNELTNEELVK
jgi:hypothetical protein